jgi:glycosyltransferase involved in cell wall biosynthesis
MSKAGAALSVIGLARVEAPERASFEHGIAWRLAADRPGSKWRGLLSSKPIIAARSGTRDSKRALTDCLAAQEWAVVVFDSICAGWAFDRVLRYRDESPRPPKIVYLAHNHEVTVARRVAAAARGAMRVVKEIEALKVVHLERRLVAEADLVTSNTPEDCRKFAAAAGAKAITFLPPGYSGPRVAARTICAAVPRRAVVIGSFDWPPKRISLEAFLAAAAPVLARAGVELQIVGAAEADYLASLRARFPTVAFIGPVADVGPHMAAARIALVPDLLGGFKLKGLDYVFNRLPVLAMRAALPGMPLKDGCSIVLFDSHQAMAEGIVARIDDFAHLNALQEAAFVACADRFDWAIIGRRLISRIQQAPTAGLATPALVERARLST